MQIRVKRDEMAGNFSDIAFIPTLGMLHVVYSDQQAHHV